MQIEGEGSILVPQIYNNYHGGPILEHVIAREAKPGSRIVVRVLDDDTSSNEAWNAILPKRINVDLTSTARVVRLGIPVQATAEGSLNLELRGVESKLVLDPPDIIAEAVIQIPSTGADGWSARGRLYDSSGNNVGTIDFAPIWVARHDPEYNALRRQLPKLLGSAVFWAVVGACCLIWYLRSTFSTRTSTVAGDTIQSA